MTTTIHTADEIGARWGVNPRWIKDKARELGVPHTQLPRKRVGFTDEQLEALVKALEVNGAPTSRSQARQRRGKGRAA